MTQKWHEIRSDSTMLICNTLQLIISIWTVVIGLFLFDDRTYFFWPPNLKNIENDMRLDTLIVITGLALFLCTILFVKNKWIIGVLLVAVGAISLALASLTFMHVIMAHYLPMILMAFCNLVLFILTLIVAHYK